MVENGAISSYIKSYEYYPSFIWNCTISKPALVAQLDACLTEEQEVAGSILGDQQHSFVEIDHEIFSTVFLSLPMIQEGHLSVSGERMCTILVKRLEG